MSLLLDLLFPRQCYACHKSGSYLCSSCQDQLSTLDLKQSRLSLFKYRSPLKEIIQDLKYQYLTDLVPFLAQISLDSLSQNYPHLLQYWQENHFTLTSIPLHWYRQNYRGFNQSELLGQSLAKPLKLSFSSNIFIRSHYTSPQVKTNSKAARRINLSRPFSLISASVPSKVILFDDVYTTGTTLKTAAAIFPKKTEIFYLTLAG